MKIRSLSQKVPWRRAWQPTRVLSLCLKFKYFAWIIILLIELTDQKFLIGLSVVLQSVNNEIQTEARYCLPYTFSFLLRKAMQNMLLIISKQEYIFTRVSMCCDYKYHLGPRHDHEGMFTDYCFKVDLWGCQTCMSCNHGLSTTKIEQILIHQT